MIRIGKDKQSNYIRESRFAVFVTKRLVRLGLIGLIAISQAAGAIGFGNGGSNNSGEFLHGVATDLLSDYEDLAFGTSDFDNYSEVNITNAFDSAVSAKQRKIGFGDGNKLSVNQTGTSNTAVVGQAGNSNVAYINQDGDGNTAAIGQLGINNEAFINQHGDDNLALIGQANLSNTSSKLSVNQIYDNNVAFITGSGGAT